MNWLKNEWKAWLGVAVLGLAGCAGPAAKEPAPASVPGWLHARTRTLGGALVVDATLRPVAWGGPG